jgi:hypothetical protein
LTGFLKSAFLKPPLGLLLSEKHQAIWWKGVPMSLQDGITVKLWLFELSGSGTLGVVGVMLLAVLLILARYFKPPRGKF